MSLDLDADLTTLLRALVDIPSVSGEEAWLATLVEQALASRAHLTVHRDGDAVVAHTDLGRPRRVVIAGHLDTVPVADNLPSQLRETPEGPVVWGRGSVDMKGGVAVQLQLAAQLAAPSVDVTWVFYDHEEVDSSLNGLGRLARNAPHLLEADFAILMEPTSAEVEGGCQGTCRVAVTAEGKAAHSARSWMGRNAIHGLSDVLARLDAYQAREVEVGGLVYREGLNAVAVAGGVAGNVVPPSARVEVNYRFAPDKTPHDALAEVERVLGPHPFEVLDMAPGARPGLDQPLAQEFVAAVGAVPRPKYGWTDVARFSALGVPAVNYGPGDPNLAHHDDEACPTDHLTRCADGLRRWLTA